MITIPFVLLLGITVEARQDLLRLPFRDTKPINDLAAQIDNEVRSIDEKHRQIIEILDKEIDALKAAGAKCDDQSIKLLIEERANFVRLQAKFQSMRLKEVKREK